MKRLFIILAAIFCFSNFAFSQQRPLITEDVDIVPEGAARLSAGVDFLQGARFPLSGLKGDLTRVGDVQVSFGLAPNVEFQIDGVIQNFLSISSAQNPSPIPLNLSSANSTNGVGDFTLSTKIKLRNETRRFPAIGFKLGVQLPNSDQARGIGVNETNVFGRILLQKKFGNKKGAAARANIFGNIGLGILTAPIDRFSQNDVVLYGLAGLFRVNKNVNIASEVNGRANTRAGRVPLGTESNSQFRIGAQIKASGLRFDTAAIFGLTKFSPRTGFIFGVTYQSPQIFTPPK
ncbi:MAG: hypothetical protein ACR2GD_10995 [Pyrinomonadaceae bacterium]